ncbi:MAG: UDP-N-acetylglucosamine 1-carboxyvinyltransferase [Candidatus Kerfeldbacteria bacterium]|nr:UDP-N-acetylglucosamine 1-carboxyvinyltransferase [Candidatus Kerfeldbacteria bacterium]
MTRFRIKGQQPLTGTIEVQGSKNAATPLLASALLATKPCTFTNVPEIEDVNRIIELLRSVGATVSRPAAHSVTVNAASVDPDRLAFSLVRTLRSSVLLMGALLGRCQRIRLPSPGGDQIGARPLAAHLDAFRELGIATRQTGETHELTQERREDVVLTMSEFSVTATENVILASVLANGHRTVLHCAAAEPSVQDLCWFLLACGARIEGVGTHHLIITGVSVLNPPPTYEVMPDPVEAGTLVCLAAAARSSLVIKNFPTFLYSELQKFREVNVHFELDRLRLSSSKSYQLADVVVRPSTGLRAVRHVHGMPYPGFYDDLLPPFTVLLTQASGTSLVHDWMYEGRLKYIEELSKMGAQIFVADPHRILVTGPSALYGAEITSYDIRAGASLLIAALIAQGTSVIGPIYQIDRGYERIDQRLNVLGASIERVPEA